MIKELKNKKNGWTIQKMMFPKGYYPASTTWRIKEGAYHLMVEASLKEGQQPDTHPLYRTLHDVEVKTTAKGTKLVGWAALSKSYYEYDREDALKDEH